MNSINQNQPEHNHKDLIGKDAVEKIKHLAYKTSTCYFCTKIVSGKSFSARPMTVQHIDDQGSLWFLGASDSKLNEELQEEATAQILFQGSEYADYLNLYGRVVVSKNKENIQALWKPMFKNWFTEGENDPRIIVIKVMPDEGYYWDTKHNVAVGFVKRIVGAIMGETLDDSVEGTIKVKEGN